MTKLFTLFGALAACMFLSGCGNQKDNFALPPGDAERGQNAFVSLGCNSCHYVADGVQRMKTGANPQIYVQLGGQVTKVKTYEDLVTSIVNPSHKLSRGPDPRHVTEDGESKMPRYNEVMTVQQLIDITTYLSSKYSVWSPYYRRTAPD
jgi:sulfur-oxidizing protein SoxX